MRSIDKPIVMQSQTESQGFLKKKYLFIALRVAVEMFELEKNDILVTCRQEATAGADSDHLLVVPVFHVVQNHDFPRVCHRSYRSHVLCRDMGLEERRQPMQMQKAGAKTCSRQSWTASFLLAYGPFNPGA